MARLLMLLVLIGLGVIATAIFRDPESLLTPAHLSQGHADLSTDCFACHRPFFGTPAAKCSACHKPEDIGRRTTTGAPLASDKTAFHQELAIADCAACHTDHQGRDNRGTLRVFAHDMLKEQTRDRCQSCHTPPPDELHRGQEESTCSTCHNTQRWSPADFDHDAYFVFDRDHRTACTTCHEPPGFETFTCYGCHEHSERKIRREHLEEGITDFENCAECHRNANEHDAKRRFRSLGGTLREEDDD